MRERSVLKIGEFARVAQVSLATLRHYEKSGLLKPMVLDPDTGYRYYSLDQLPRMHRILALKDLGFSLEQIARMLEDDLSLDQLRGMFMLKQVQAQHMLATEQARLARIAVRLSQIEQEGIMPTYEVLLKQVDPLLVASVRTLLPLGDNPGKLYGTLMAYLDQQHVQYAHPTMLLLHSRHEWHGDERAIDVEAVVPLSTTLAGNEQITIRTLPGGLMACTVHIGNDLSLGRAHAALHRWMKDSAHQIIGPPRLVQLQRVGQYITELQFPVKVQGRLISGA